ncbi:MAG: type II secretion system protein GspM [Myxococcota bacterium]
MSENVAATPTAGGGGGSAFSRLSSREQIMLGVLGVVLLLFLVAGITYVVSRQLDRAERRLNERREQLALIEGLEGKYRAAESEQAQQRAKLQRNPVQLFSLLQKSAGELGLKLDNLNERKSAIKEAGVDEISVDVTLKEMSITKLNKFLEKMEGPPNTGLVKVTKLKVKTGFQNEDLLDVNMTVSTYRAQGGGTEEAAAGTPAGEPDLPTGLPGDEPLPGLEDVQ